MVARIPLNTHDIDGFCRRWKIRRLSLFGSVLRDDFSADSDVDVLVVFEDDARWSLWDWPYMEEQLSALLSHPAHIVEESGLRNPFLRRAIFQSREIVYDR